MAFTESCHISQTLYVDFFPMMSIWYMWMVGWLLVGWLVGSLAAGWLAGWSFVWLVDHWVVK